MSSALQEWLRVAAEGLSPEARRRFLSEIEAHHASAVQDYLAAGFSAEEAEQRALEDLGAPEEVSYNLQRAYARPLSLIPLRAFVAGHGASLLLVVLALVALYGVQRLTRLPIEGRDFGPVAASALLLQMTTLVLALMLPLRFGDLDLSTGIVVMMGALIAASGSVPTDLGPAVLLAGALGALLGLAHGLCAVVLRRSVARLTLLSGGLLAAVLGFFPQIHNLGLSSPDRLTVWWQTLLLFLVALALVGLAALSGLLPRTVEDESIMDDAPRSWGLGGWLWRAVLLLPLVCLLLILASINYGWQYAWQDPLLFLRTIAHRVAHFPGPLNLASVIIVVTTLLLLTLVRTLGTSAAGRWLRQTNVAARGRQPSRVLLARLAALMLCSMLAAVVGVLTFAQGIRDGTYAQSASFYILVPPAALVIGGVPWIAGRLRYVGGLLGGLATAGLLIPTSGDNLGPSAAVSLALAAGMSLFWRSMSGQQRSRWAGLQANVDMQEAEPPKLMIQRG